jgi:hypothetical protein
MDENDPIMRGLKHKVLHLKGRCRLCIYKSLCTGAMRVRALRTFGDRWAPDPQCFISDEEIGLTDEKKKELILKGENFKMPEELTQ